MQSVSRRYVCPYHLNQNIFTTAAIDNLDHKFTSANATLSYYGTTISIFQHAEKQLQFATFRINTTNIEKNKHSSCQTHTPACKPEPPPSNDIAIKVSFISFREKTKSWLEKLCNVPETLSERINFFSFYSLNSLHEKCPYSELFWSVFSRIQSEYQKIWTRITPNTDTFHF